VQGIGTALYEDNAILTRRGSRLASTMIDYLLPSSAEETEESRQFAFSDGDAIPLHGIWPPVKGIGEGEQSVHPQLCCPVQFNDALHSLGVS